MSLVAVVVFRALEVGLLTRLAELLVDRGEVTWGDMTSGTVRDTTFDLLQTAKMID